MTSLFVEGRVKSAVRFIRGLLMRRAWHGFMMAMNSKKKLVPRVIRINHELALLCRIKFPGQEVGNRLTQSNQVSYFYVNFALPKNL